MGLDEWLGRGSGEYRSALRLGNRGRISQRFLLRDGQRLP